MLWSFTLSQLYDVRIKDNHKNLKNKIWPRKLNNGIVNSQWSSNKLFSIDFLILIKSRYDSCIHIAFFVRAVISNLFFFYFLSLLVFFLGALHSIISSSSSSFVRLFNRSALLGDWILCWNLVLLLRTRLLWK